MHFRFSALLFVALLAFTLTGCPKPPTVTDTPGPRVTNGADETPALPSEYRFPLPAEPRTLDPARTARVSH